MRLRPGRDGGGGGAAGPDNSSVMFARVRRRPMGQTPNQSVASGKCLIIERIIEPFGDELIDTYFRRANACFPLLDEGSFRDQFRRQPAHISSALLASVYAHALTFWSQPRRAAGRHCPDSRFVWNQATDALYSELQLCPGMSTVVAVLLDVGGRPSTSMIGNGVLIGSAVSIAHGLGLHRDPTDWDISEPEKRIRVQIWWALVVHDRWFSLAYGTPPHIQGKFHDAPRPRADGSVNTVFLALVSLSEVLDAFLVHIYALKLDRQATSEFDPGTALRRWEESLIGDIRRLIIYGKDLSAPGASNLRLSYLFVRLLQRRMELDSTADKSKHADIDDLSGRYVHLREAAEDIVRLVQALRAPQLNDFWLPTAAFIFTSTIAFLLRVALETEKTANGLGESVSLSLAKDLLAALTGHQQNFGWDLGDACIAQYADVVEELRKATPVANNTGQGDQETAVPLIDWQDFDVSGFPDVEELFPNLWDMFDSNY
ncbi:fungal-specific transcription factor domain-containing protein [Diaporthe sp. PMI_573]|nr:fungal-specific transcription factor domain-containing protein [Diaporthaceae sp. PMI_573]